MTKKEREQLRWAIKAVWDEEDEWTQGWMTLFRLANLDTSRWEQTMRLKPVTISELMQRTDHDQKTS